MKIYHNPKCSNSRGALEIFKKHNAVYECIEYLILGITTEEIYEILHKLNAQPLDIVRQKEGVWKEKFVQKNMTDEEIIAALVEYPILLQRPIVVTDNLAVIARPPELLEVLFI